MFIDNVANYSNSFFCLSGDSCKPFLISASSYFKITSLKVKKYYFLIMYFSSSTLVMNSKKNAC